MDIDRRRIAAVQTLEALGFRFQAGKWLPPATAATPLSWLANADDLHGAPMQRADALAGCTEGSHEETELKAVADANVRVGAAFVGHRAHHPRFGRAATAGDDRDGGGC